MVSLLLRARIVSGLRLGLGVVALLTSIAVVDARADVLFTIDRISDTRGTISGSGFLPTTVTCDCVNDYILALIDPYGIGPQGYDNKDIFLSSTMVIGGNAVVDAHILGTGFTDHLPILPALYFWADAGFAPGSVVSGALEFELPDYLSLASEGSTGAVYWGIYTPIQVGIWTIGDSTTTAPVPEGSTFGLVAVGTLCLFWFRSNREHACRLAR